MREGPPAERAVRSRVPVDDFLQGDPDQADYADSFELHLGSPDARTAEEWARAGLEGAPALMKWIIRAAQRFVLGLQLAPKSSSDHILGWTIEASEPEMVRLTAASRFMRARIIGRREDPTTVRLTTILFYDRPRTARTLWSVVAPVHRRVARYLLKRAAQTLPG